jgi:hypothetical protein
MNISKEEITTSFLRNDKFIILILYNRSIQRCIKELNTLSLFNENLNIFLYYNR